MLLLEDTFFHMNGAKVHGCRNQGAQGYIAPPFFMNLYVKCLFSALIVALECIVPTST